MYPPDCPSQPSTSPSESITSLTQSKPFGLAQPESLHLTEWNCSQRAAAGHISKLQDEFSLFFDPAGGTSQWCPKSAHVHYVLTRLIKSEYSNQGFCEAVSPNMYSDSTWEPDGRWKHYRDEISKLETQREFMLTTSCSGHCLLYGHQIPLYSELPIKLADFGVLHRSIGICKPFRVPFNCFFDEDDSHIFCRPDQITDEIKGCLEFISYFYEKILNMTMKFYVAIKNESKETNEAWKNAQKAILGAFRELEMPYIIDKASAPHYGPKVQILMRDKQDRFRLYAHLQLDFELPERFDLAYISEDGRKLRPILIHRSIVNSVETILAVIESEYAGYWPFWLSPNQVVVIPVSVASIPYARTVEQRLIEADIEVHADLSCVGSLNRRIKNAIVTKCNFILVVGKNEAVNGTVNVRTRNDTVLGEFTVEEVIAQFEKFIEDFSDDNQCAAAFDKLQDDAAEKLLCC
ncbi:unnamed protein product [Cylicocyclus nassatus]|uniref:threonine--tRNA ligase n=1 Tax=Cylicocyclus nassatus TaxID=53992 RepID=A0AA36GW42_CYLNA|nr:unnamed protein product [Cylicocyclus nassatus]